MKKKKYTPPHKKLFQTILKFRVAHLMKAYSKSAENNMKINAGYFSCIVFKGLLPHFRENSGLCGEGYVNKMESISLSYQFHIHNYLNNE